MQSSILARRILWTEEPGGLQSIGFQRARQNYSDSACIVKVQPFSFQKFSYRHTANEEPYIEENLLNLSDTNQSLFFESQCTAFISHPPAMCMGSQVWPVSQVYLSPQFPVKEYGVQLGEVSYKNFSLAPPLSYRG